MSLRLDLPEARLEVAVVRRARKSIGIRIVAGRIEVAAPPRVTLSALQAVLDARRDWIARHWRRQQALLSERQAWPAALNLQGRTLALQRDAEPLRRACCDGDTLRVGGDESACRDQVAAFLREEARRVFAQRMARLAPFAVRAPAKLALSSARTRWGSCNAAGVIRLNWRLILAPEAVLDYVIAHELAHLRHMNHSAAFWLETERLCPAWRPARQWLKRQGEGLFTFG